MCYTRCHFNAAAAAVINVIAVMYYFRIISSVSSFAFTRECLKFYFSLDPDFLKPTYFIYYYYYYSDYIIGNFDVPFIGNTYSYI